MNSLIIVLMPIVLMVGVGSLQNTMVADGYSSAVTLTCPGYPDVTCQNSGNVGCQAQPAQCTLSGTSFAFLNGKSPFTQLAQGNIFALFTALQGAGFTGAGAQKSWGGSHGPFDAVQESSYLYFSANCYGMPNTGTAQRNWAISSCTQASTDNANVSKSDATTWNNWNTAQSSFSATTPFFHITGNASGFVFGCNFLASINYTALANGPGFNYFGCDLVKGSGTGQITNATWSLLVAMPDNLGAMPAGKSHQFLFAQLENWDTYDCINSQTAGGGVTAFNSPPCQDFINSFKGVSIGGSATTFVPNSSAAIVLGFFGGILLLMLGLGLQFGMGGGVSAGVNTQGTRLAQVMGIGLIVYLPLYSEFGGWFTAGNALDVLPNGLDFVALIIVTGMFFLGLYYLATGSVTEGS